MIGENGNESPAERFPNTWQLPQAEVSNVNIAPNPLRYLGKFDGYQLIRQLAQKRIVVVRMH